MRDKHDYGAKMLNRLNKGVEKYDVDYQYQILIKVVEHEKAVAAEHEKNGTTSSEEFME